VAKKNSNITKISNVNKQAPFGLQSAFFVVNDSFVLQGQVLVGFFLSNSGTITHETTI
jgi:hypothetical protein